jgi:hypothetical protein
MLFGRKGGVWRQPAHRVLTRQSLHSENSHWTALSNKFIKKASAENQRHRLQIRVFHKFAKSLWKIFG